MSRVIGFLIALRTTWRMLRGRGPAGDTPPPDAAPHAPTPGREDPSRRELPADGRHELWVALLLFAAAGLALSFIAVLALDKSNTQLLGLAMGGALLLLAGATILAGKLVVPQETSVEPRDALLVPEAAQEVSALVHQGGDGISRRGLLVCAGCVAGGAVAAAAASPIASLGPRARVLHESPWRRGIRMIDETGQPLAASEIQIGSFYTALPEGEDSELFGAGLLVIRLPTAMIHLPPARRAWTPGGIMAFSKICPHAGCAISLYRYPTYGPTSTEQPAFTCPCHYSTFTPADGGNVIFGPAGRPLPQLPVMIDTSGNLRAAGIFDEDIGPAWWGTRRA
ncbi:MAG TPA: Rieske (2Fe-2S) protein [Solirubrobacteraceae bacterium]|nr:Rieske (2Fe-2S) protein [Solirubrobacteraceae bacterium]